MTETLDVQRAPLNLFEAARVTLPSTGAWVDVYAPPRYREPPPIPGGDTLTYETTSTVTSAYVCNLGDDPAVVSVRINDGTNQFLVVNLAAIAAAPAINTTLNMLSSIIKSGETLQARVVSGPSCAMHVSFSQRTEELIEEVT